MPFKPNSFFKFNVNHYDFFINLRDLHKIFYTLDSGFSKTGVPENQKCYCTFYAFISMFFEL